MQGPWTVSSTFPLPEALPLPTAPLSTLRLRHFLSSTVRGGSSVPPEELELFDFDSHYLHDSVVIPSFQALHPQGFWRCGCPRSTLILSPSIHSRSKWSVREISVSELGNIFTVPRNFFQVVLQHPGVEFWTAVPGGLLCRVWDNLAHLNEKDSPQVTVHTKSDQASTQLADIETNALIESASESNQQGRSFDFSVAVKADDAKTPTFIWDERVWSLGYQDPAKVETFRRRYNGSPLDTIRKYMLRYWCRLVLRSLLFYWKFNQRAGVTPGDQDMELEASRDCLRRATGADWWEWRQGSSLFFWRWPIYARKLALKGHPPWFTAKPPQYKVPQRPEPDEKLRAQIRGKLDAPISKSYIAPGKVLSLTSYFAVPKGETDLRIVYDASKSGLNKVLWTPNFQLPTSDTLTDLLGPTSWMSDLDLGEHFHNFPLHEELQCYCGIDIRPYYSSPTGNRTKTMWRRWVRCMMGLRPSPYNTIQSTHLAYEVANGCRHDPTNALQWDRVALNLPGDPSYTPCQPWVYKVRRDGHMAGSTPAYVDDLRPVGYSEEHCFLVGHQTASRLGYLGIQNASRKTRPPSQRPGAWAGIVAQVSADRITVSTSQEKWEKAQTMLRAIRSEWAATGTLNHKSLEQRRGFFVHLQRVYPAIAPFLKGMHLTLDSWRPGRDHEGWRMTDWDPDLEVPSSSSPPTLVHPVPRFGDDLDCLDDLFASDTPPLRVIRSNQVALAVYGFVDASGAGFGSSLLLPTGNIAYRQGVWGRDTDSASSNYRELCNLVETIEEGCASGSLRNCEVFLCTDNSVAEGAFYRGNSPSRVLFELVRRLCILDMHGQIMLHVIHVAGSRMIAQGTDGLSRGDFSAGVMTGQHMLDFVPLHLSGIKRSPLVLPWLQSWLPVAHLQPLSPEDWYEKGHGLSGGAFNRDNIWIPNETSDTWVLWDPPPAAGAAALHELGISRHKRTHLGHVFVCPRLFTQHWRKKLFHLADVVLEIAAGRRAFWPLPMHEPLLLGIVLPFSSSFPWQLRGSDRILALERQLRQVWQDPLADERPLLRQLCACT